MALLWQFQPNRVPKSFMLFSWQIHGIFMALPPEDYFKLVIIGYIMLVSVYLSSVFFLLLILFSLMVFQVDQSSCVFLIKGYKKHPNQQAKPTTKRYLIFCLVKKYCKYLCFWLVCLEIRGEKSEEKNDLQCISIRMLKKHHQKQWFLSTCVETA